MTAFIDFVSVKEKHSILQVAQMLQLTLTQKGDQYRACCPIHKGTNPREFVITGSKNLFFCFGGCGGGDQIALVAKVRDVKQNEAANLIASHFGTVHGSPAGTAHKTAPVTAPPAPAGTGNGFNAEAYAARLDASHEALAGLGLSPDTLTAFKAGYASTGLMRGRLALPYHNAEGNILGFCGRALKDEQPQLVFPKTFVPESVVFNWHQVRDTDFAYLCTDPLAVLKAHENGIDNAVAALGIMNADFLQVLSLWMEQQHVQSIEPM
jgi:DNA primase